MTFPAAFVGLSLAISWWRRRSLVPALPAIMRVTYVVYPTVSSIGFRALAPCRRFDNVDGSALSFLPSDWAVQCPIDGSLAALAWTAALAYGLGVPLAYTMLLRRCRDAILSRKPTALSEALRFLHREMQPAALFWPLVEASRALLLSGFLALLAPGSVTQLLCGLCVAFAFAVLQIWSAPYAKPSNNFMAMAASAGLVLNFVASLGVQVNEKFGGGLIDESMLTAALYVSALSMFVVALVAFLSARSLRIDLAEARRAFSGANDETIQRGASEVLARAIDAPPLAVEDGRAACTRTADATVEDRARRAAEQPLT